MGRSLFVAAALLGPVLGCVHLDTEQRVERGARLRSFERELPQGAPRVEARVEPQWPALRLRFFTAQSCSLERVDVFTEDLVTEKRDPSAPYVLATGASTAAWGGILLAALPLFSDSPNVSVVDGVTYTYASDRIHARNFGLVLVGLGVPAVVAGVVGLLRHEETRAPRQVEELAGVSERPCPVRPRDGELEIAALSAPEPLVARTRNAELTLDESQARAVSLDAMLLDGEVVGFAPDERAKLEAYQACLHVLPLDLEGKGKGELAVLLADARRCAEVKGVSAENAVKEIEAALAR